MQKFLIKYLPAPPDTILTAKEVSTLPMCSRCLQLTFSKASLHGCTGEMRITTKCPECNDTGYSGLMSIHSI